MPDLKTELVVELKDLPLSEMPYSSTPSATVTPWLQRLQPLTLAYPALSGFLNRVFASNQIAQGIVRDEYRKRYQRLPGRCALLIFHTDRVEDVHFTSPTDLSNYFETSQAELAGQHRLWLLEDLEPQWMDVLGSHLEIDPLVLSEQTNTFYFTDSKTIPARQLPSMVRPATKFSLRYFEFRLLLDPSTILPTTNQMTFDINSRRIERWRDIDTSKLKQEFRHAFVRRCASFWSNQTSNSNGWDAVALVDAPFDSLSWRGPDLKSACTILRDPKDWQEKRGEMWKSRAWDKPGSVEAAPDTSTPYHRGPSTFTTSTVTAAFARENPELVAPERNRTCLLDEQVLYWTTLATPSEISLARAQSANAATCLLKFVASSWSDSLDLVQSTISLSEYFSDDNQATVDSSTSGSEWRKRLNSVIKTMGDMHFLRRQMNHFASTMQMNLERVGVFNDGRGAVDRMSDLPEALMDAQRDFIHLNTRLQPYVARAAALSHIANELANLHASFKSVQDSELGLTLSITASVVFPATLVASIFSMGGDFLPGQASFWIFWATTVPLTVVLASLLIFSGQIRSLADSQVARWRELRAKRRNGRVAA